MKEYKVIYVLFNDGEGFPRHSLTVYRGDVVIDSERCVIGFDVRHTAAVLLDAHDLLRTNSNEFWTRKNVDLDCEFIDRKAVR